MSWKKKKMPKPPERDEFAINYTMLQALTIAEIEHIVEVYGRGTPHGAALWGMAGMFSLPWGILIGWFIWG